MAQERDKDAVRGRILAAAIDLLNIGGRDAVTTRAVADAAGVQAPALYRQFGDKQGLLDAVAEHGFTAYLQTKMAREFGQDPVADLRAGWDLHIEFGLSHPAIYLLMYADPRPGAKSPAAEKSQRLLEAHLRIVAAAGRLRVSEEQAANLFHAAACGVVLTLLGKPSEHRDQALSAIAREAAIGLITTDTPAMQSAGTPIRTAAVALRALLPGAEVLSGGERVLLTEWLDRLAVRD